MRRGKGGSLALAAAVACLGLSSACDLGTPRFSVIPSPAVPGVATAAPLVWDARDELAVWVNNPVTKGPVPISLDGDGVDAVIRFETSAGVDGWVLRGPDLDPPVPAARAVRLRYRWQANTTASRTFSVVVVFEALDAPFPPQQPQTSRSLEPTPDWTTTDFTPGFGPFELKYVYLFQTWANRGVFEIDRIELVR